jgi:hypothetical protein
VGKRVPQARRQGGAQIRYRRPKGFTFGVQARFSTRSTTTTSTRCASAVLDARCPFRHSLNEWVGFFLAGENLTDADYDVGRTPFER